MENVFLTFAIILVVGSPAFGLIFGLILLDERGTDEDWYLFVVARCLGLAAICIVGYLVAREISQLDVYDAKIKVHYVDGYSTTIRKDSILRDELPRIEEGYKYSGIAGKGGRRNYLGTYSLYSVENAITELSDMNT